MMLKKCLGPRQHQTNKATQIIKKFNIKCRNETELSNAVWKIKEPNLQPTVKWQNIRKCHHINRGLMR